MDKEKLFTSMNMISALADQIAALLDLMSLVEDAVDIRSIRTASEMCATMQVELMREVENIETELRERW